MIERDNFTFYFTGHYQIGVHIADVSYFVREQSALDTEAAQRTTSVYLVERVKSKSLYSLRKKFYSI